MSWLVESCHTDLGRWWWNCPVPCPADSRWSPGESDSSRTQTPSSRENETYRCWRHFRLPRRARARTACSVMTSCWDDLERGWRWGGWGWFVALVTRWWAMDICEIPSYCPASPSSLCNHGNHSERGCYGDHTALLQHQQLDKVNRR